MFKTKKMRFYPVLFIKIYQRPKSQASSPKSQVKKIVLENIFFTSVSWGLELGICGLVLQIFSNLFFRE